MKWQIDVITWSAMKGFGLGLVLAVLLGTIPLPITAASIFSNPLVIIFTLLGLGLGFEDATSNGSKPTQ